MTRLVAGRGGRVTLSPHTAPSPPDTAAPDPEDNTDGRPSNSRPHSLVDKTVADTPRRGFADSAAGRWLARLLIALVAGLVRLLHTTCRVRVVDPGGYLSHTDPPAVVLALWHNRLVFAPLFFPRRYRRRFLSLASLSADGGYAAQFMGHFLGGMIRGSSSRGGTEALRQMKRELDKGWTIALTVDGPRGPRYAVHPGAVLLAEMTGAPVVPFAWNARRKWQLKSWDRTQIPKPFARINFVVGTPIQVARRMSADERQAACENLRRQMLELTEDFD
ncbi:MAG: hypothetical protein BWZ02_00155 [Lentisphaerae bacterium ADurb.BinA184]|nr:MAG: hypothetical protein BWZ02_00155 [Lentisphaerae bacterium ADurb.BinA184]